MIRITSKQEGFYRCGIPHPAKPTDYPGDWFKPEELKALKAEPMLTVEFPDGEPPEREPKAKPKSQAAGGESAEELARERREIEDSRGAINEREAALNGKEEAFSERVTALESRVSGLAEKETALAEREAALDSRESDMAERELALAERETEAAGREREPRLEAAIGKVMEGKKSGDFMKDGRPTTGAIEREAGISISADERDRMFAELYPPEGE